MPEPPSRSTLPEATTLLEADFPAGCGGDLFFSFSFPPSAIIVHLFQGRENLSSSLYRFRISSSSSVSASPWPLFLHRDPSLPTARLRFRSCPSCDPLLSLPLALSLSLPFLAASVHPFLCPGTSRGSRSQVTLKNLADGWKIGDTYIIYCVLCRFFLPLFSAQREQEWRGKTPPIFNTEKTRLASFFNLGTLGTIFDHFSITEYRARIYPSLFIFAKIGGHGWLIVAFPR